MRQLFFMLVMVLVGLQGFAQHKGNSPEQRAKRQSKHLSKELGLSVEQSQKLETATLERITAIQNAKANKDREAIKAARQKFDEQLKAILNEEQLKKLEAFREEKGDKFVEKRLEKMKTELALTEEQAEQVGNLLETHMDEMQETPAGGGAKKAVLEKFENELKKILSAEQFQKFLDNKEERKENRREHHQKRKD